MKPAFIIILLIQSIPAYVQKKELLLDIGLDYRQHPIDIENVSRGGYSSNGGFYGSKFWQTPSALINIGYPLNQHLIFSASGYIRYNHFHWPDELDYTLDVSRWEEIKNWKYDFFIQAEKRFLFRKKSTNLFANLGLGVVNMNTRYNFSIRATNSQGQDSLHFNGTLTRIAPRVSVGYQYRKLRVSTDCYVIEGPQLINLASLWIGWTMSYELKL